MEKTYEKRGYLNEDFRVFSLRDHRAPEIDYHYHEFNKAIFFVSGNASYYIDGSRYILEPGDVILIKRGLIHRPDVMSDAVYERIIFYIAPELLAMYSEEETDLESCFSEAAQLGRCVLRPPRRLSEKLRAMAENAVKAERDARFGGRMLARLGVLSLAVELCRAVRDTGVGAAPTEKFGEKTGGLIRYIDSHLTEELTIDKLAACMYMSKYHMMRRFREETGFSVHEYIAHRRLNLAKGLMAGGMPATEACYKCGYGSYSSFLRAYKKFSGESPSRSARANLEYVD